MTKEDDIQKVTQKEVDQLLNTFSMMLPYGLRCIKKGEEVIFTLEGIISNSLMGFVIYKYSNITNKRVVYEVTTTKLNKTGLVLPCLRSLISMTSREREEFEDLGWRIDKNYNIWCIGHSKMIKEGIDWLNRHYFNYFLPPNLVEEVDIYFYKLYDYAEI